MKLVNALKTVCDFLLLISFAALIPAYGKTWVLIVPVTALAFVSAFLLQSIPDKMPIKVLCALLPALGLLAAKSMTEIVITSIIIAFYVLIAMEDKIEMHYEDYKFWFAIPAVPIIVLFVVTATYWPIRSTATVCAGLYLFLGVLVLRRKRIGSRATAGIKTVNLAEMAGVLVFDAAVCFVIYTVTMALKDVIVLLITPIALIMQLPAILISVWTDDLYMWLSPDFEHIGKEKENADDFWASSADSGIVPTFNGRTGAEWAYMILGTALVISAVVLLLWLLYSFWKMLHFVDTETDGKYEIEGGQQEPFSFRRNRRRKRKNDATLTNNEKVRAIYAQYLFCMKACGVKIRRQSTSEDVLAESVEIVEPEKAEQLRELYLKARYNDAAELSDAEVEQARNLFNYITANAANWGRGQCHLDSKKLKNSVSFKP